VKDRLDFSYESWPMRVVFRPGAATTATADEAAGLGLRRLLVVCALDATDAPSALRDLAERLGAPRSLAELGLKEADLTVAAAQAAGQAYANPREVTAEGALVVLRAAYEGAPPASVTS